MHLFIYVSDLGRSRGFYTDVLGLQVLIEEEGYLRVGIPRGIHIGMEEGKPSQVGARGVEIHLEVDDVDAWADRLRADGVTFEIPPADMPWGARHALFRDPDGYRLSIFTRTALGDEAVSPVDRPVLSEPRPTISS